MDRKPLNFKKIGWIALGAIVLVYLLILGAYKLLEDRFVYHPTYTTREVNHLLPTKLGLDIDEVTVNTPDGEALFGWLTYADPAKANGQWVIFLHGNAGNISDMEYPRRYVALSKMGLNVLAIDYRGFGKSTGTPSEQGLYTDAQSAYDYLRKTRKVSSDDIVIYGYSLGTGVASELASHNHAGGLVLEAPYTSLPAIGAGQYPWLPVSMLMKNRYDTKGRISKVNYPLLILHATEDKIIPYAEGEAVLAAATSAKSMVPLRGDHISASILDSAKFYGAFEVFVSGLK
jgi:pimeloyl-ACP methyl ester carboxylesterase